MAEEEARQEFQTTKTSVQELHKNIAEAIAVIQQEAATFYDKTSVSFDSFRAEIDKVKSEWRDTAGPGSGGGGRKGYLPLKQLVPSVFGKDEAG